MPNLLELNTELGYSAEQAIVARGSEWVVLPHVGRFAKALVIGRPSIVALALLARQYASVSAWLIDTDEHDIWSRLKHVLDIDLDAEHCRSEDVPAKLSAFAGQFDLIVVECAMDRLTRAAGVQTGFFIDSLVAALSDAGQYCIVTSIDSRLAGMRRNPEPSSDLSLRQLQRALPVSPAQQTYFLYPDHERPQEILGWSSALPHERSHAIAKVLDKIGLVAPLHSSVAILGARKPSRSMLEAIIDDAMSCAGADGPRQIDRCLARDNGTITVLLAGGEAIQPAVLRVPLSVAAETRLRNAWSGLAEMRQAFGWLRKLTPEPMSCGACLGMPYFLERQCFGVTADRLVGDDDSRNRVWNSLLAFLLKFGEPEHGWNGSVDPAFSSKVDAYFSDVRGYSEEADADLSRLYLRLCDRLDGRAIPLVHVHGDFNPTNVLFDRRGDEITGIIDWDACSSGDFPMQDIVHFLIHRYRVDRQLNIGAAIVAAVEGHLFDEAEDGLLKRYRQALSIDDDLSGCLMVLYWIRHVALHVSYRNGPLPSKWVHRNLLEPLSRLVDIPF